MAQFDMNNPNLNLNFNPNFNPSFNPSFNDPTLSIPDTHDPILGGMDPSCFDNTSSYQQLDYYGNPAQDDQWLETFTTLAPQDASCTATSLNTCSIPEPQSFYSNAGTANLEFKNSRILNGQPTPPSEPIMTPSTATMGISPCELDVSQAGMLPLRMKNGMNQHYANLPPTAAGPQLVFQPNPVPPTASRKPLKTTAQRPNRVTKAPRPVTTRAKRSTSTTDDGESAKRAKALERNRAAATKCRIKKKEYTDQLEHTAKLVEEERKQLDEDVKAAREELLALKNIMLLHANCGHEAINLHMKKMVQDICEKDNYAPKIPLNTSCSISPNAVSFDRTPSKARFSKNKRSTSFRAKSGVVQTASPCSPGFGFEN